MANRAPRKPARERYERRALTLPSAPDAGLYLLLYPVKRWPVAGSGMGSHVGSAEMCEGDEYRTVHVISPHAGGEVRGYVLTGDTLRLRLPSYPERWPEIDAAACVATAAARVALPVAVGDEDLIPDDHDVCERCREIFHVDRMTTDREGWYCGPCYEVTHD